MARAAARSRRGKAADVRPSLFGRIAREGGGLGLLGASLLAGAALLAYAPDDPIFAGAEGRAGVLGATFAAIFFRSLGFGAWVLTGALFVLGVRFVSGRGVPPASSRFWPSTALLLLAVSTIPPLVHAIAPDVFVPTEGGRLGRFLARNETWLAGTWGALLLNGGFLVVGLLGATGVPLSKAVGGVGLALGWIAAGVAAVAARIWAFLRASFDRAHRAVAAVLAGLQRGAGSLAVWRERRARRARVAAARGESEEPGPVVADEEEKPLEPYQAPKATRGASGEPAIVDHVAQRESSRSQTQESFHFEDDTPTGPFELPDLAIFQVPPAGARTYDRDSLIMNSRILEKKLQDFGVGGRVVTVHPGPVVTMYEFEPASGIKVNRIVGLADDLALALRALSVRIIAPLPGKSVVGIEVANPEREVVYLRDSLESESFRQSKSRLNIALGKDIFGNPCHADLAKMPHLLVAGATGTGKSVFLNALLCSILCRARPDELKLLLIDPKLLELSIDEGIPHLIADVVTNPKRASAALAGVVHKMEERYQMMAALGVRSIDQFNARCDKELEAGVTTFRLKPKPGEEEGREVPYQRFPYIVVVIDELADLMVVSARDVEESLQRLAQMARAAGIHLVLATQRPSVDVLTGIIKANFPARISFQVSSRTDSRTILDQNGADHLLGQGDMLFLPPGTSKLQRIHGAFVSEEEVAELAKFLRSQGEPAFDETLLRVREEAEAKEERDDDVDEMFDRAVAIVAETRNASISYIQRRLKVGYNRAARMIEQMEIEGMIGPQEGTKAREVFVRPIDDEE